MTLRYRLTIEPDDNGTILVTSPDLPIVTYGADEAEAIRHAADAIDVIIESLMDGREDVPVPSVSDDHTGPFATVSLQTELKVKLHRAMLAAGLTRADLQRRLGWQRESVDRLFRLHHNSRLTQIEDAYRALSKIISIDVQDAA